MSKGEQLWTAEQRGAVVARHVVLVIASAGFLAPLVWLVATAVTPQSSLSAGEHLSWLERPTLANFRGALDVEGYVRHYANTIAVTGVRVFGQVLFSTLGGFALAQFEPPGRRTMGAIAVTAVALPDLIPLVSWAVLARWSNLNDSYWALVLPLLFSSFGLLYFRQVFSAVPRERIEAAVMDGASAARQYWHVGLPFARPQIIVFASLVVLLSWSEYLWVLLASDDSDHRMLSVTIRLFVGSHGNANLGVRAALTVLSILPLLAVLLVALRNVDDSFNESKDGAT